MNESPNALDRARQRGRDAADIAQCSCGTFGNATSCPLHTQADFDAARTQGELDVERLAEALDVLSYDGLEYSLMAPEEREDRFDAAERLAAEYDRLATPPSKKVPGGPR